MHNEVARAPPQDIFSTIKMEILSMIKFTIKTVAIMLAVGMGLTNSSQASLLDRGNGLIYNTDTDTTWMQNANWFGQNWWASGSYIDGNLVSKIIAANNGIVNDTPNWADAPPYSGIHILGSEDFGVSGGHNLLNGTVNWWAAKATVNYLNYIGYGGSNQWRLPSISELTQLFISELGVNSGGVANTNPFIQIQSNNYWSSNEEETDKAFAYELSTYYFYQPVISHKGITGANTWAVSDGSISTVPVPSAIWLFGSGFYLFRLNQRKITIC